MIVARGLGTTKALLATAGLGLALAVTPVPPVDLVIAPAQALAVVATESLAPQASTAQIDVGAIQHLTVGAADAVLQLAAAPDLAVPAPAAVGIAPAHDLVVAAAIIAGIAAPAVDALPAPDTLAPDR